MFFRGVEGRTPKFRMFGRNLRMMRSACAKRKVLIFLRIHCQSFPVTRPQNTSRPTDIDWASSELNGNLRAAILLSYGLVHASQSLKASVLLAGSCMEAVLLDLMLSYPAEAEKELGGDARMRKATPEQLPRVAH